ncbi:MAG TPA: hypothetical protein VJ553_07015 [Candidatus Paceibacterota bacterium]|nr:hypothetical protein [Candidatus Paceibacterota bacterium]
MRRQRYLTLVAGIILVIGSGACGQRNEITGSGAEYSEEAPAKLLEFRVTELSPLSNQTVSTPFYATIAGEVLLDKSMLPAWAGIVYVEGDGSNRITHWSTLGMEDASYGDPSRYDKPQRYHQEFGARDYGTKGEYCSSYQLCKDYLPGKEINAIFFVGKKGMNPLEWDPATGHIYIYGERVAYHQFLPVGYRFR